MSGFLIAIGIILGAVFGSFACCQVWRLRLKEKKLKSPGKRSVCLSCGKKLSPLDNIPIISWLALRGRCRYCKTSIGLAEIFSEIALAFVFPFILLHFESDIATGNVIGILRLILFLVITIVFMILFLYDAMWGRLPTSLLITSIILASIFRLLSLDYSAELSSQLFTTLAAVGLLGGLYYILYLVSNERWVGGGDWMIALAIALILGNWWLALAELFVSNSLALGGILASCRNKKDKKAPFAPYLITACILIFLLQNSLIIQL